MAFCVLYCLVTLLLRFCCALFFWVLILCLLLWFFAVEADSGRSSSSWQVSNASSGCCFLHTRRYRHLQMISFSGLSSVWNFAASSKQKGVCHFSLLGKRVLWFFGFWNMAALFYLLLFRQPTFPSSYDSDESCFVYVFVSVRETQRERES